MYRSHHFLAAALDFTDWQNNTQKPWFCYFSSARMHVNTNLKPLANLVQAMIWHSVQIPSHQDFCQSAERLHGRGKRSSE